MATNLDNEISHNQTQSLNKGGELTAQKNEYCQKFLWFVNMILYNVDIQHILCH